MNETHLDKTKIHTQVFKRSCFGGEGRLSNICLLVMRRDFFFNFLASVSTSCHQTLEGTFFGAGARQEQPCLYNTLECYAVFCGSFVGLLIAPCTWWNS